MNGFKVTTNVHAGGSSSPPPDATTVACTTPDTPWCYTRKEKNNSPYETQCGFATYDDAVAAVTSLGQSRWRSVFDSCGS